MKNSTSNEASFCSFNAKATQGSQQFDAKSFGSDYPEVQSEILPVVTSSGVLVFPPMNASPPTVLNLEARTDNFQVDFQPYRFTVPGS